MTTAVWAMLAGWAGVLLVLVGIVYRVHATVLARLEKSQDLMRAAFEKSGEESRKDARLEYRLIDDHMKEIELRSIKAGLEQTVALQRAIDAIVPRLQDQISSTSERVARVEERLVERQARR